MEYILPCEIPIFTLDINSPILIPGYKYSLTWNESMYTHFQNENFNTSLLETFEEDKDLNYSILVRYKNIVNSSPIPELGKENNFSLPILVKISIPKDVKLSHISIGTSLFCYADTRVSTSKKVDENIQTLSLYPEDLHWRIFEDKDMETFQALKEHIKVLAETLCEDKTLHSKINKNLLNKLETILINSKNNSSFWEELMDAFAYFLLTESQQYAYILENDPIEAYISLSKIITDSLFTENTSKKTQKKTSRDKDTPKEEKKLTLKEKVIQAGLPKDQHQKVFDEIDRLENIPPNTLEAALLKDWVNLVCSIPWTQTKLTTYDLKTLRNEMDKTHYGLPEVKDYLLEHLTIERIKQKTTGSVICFLGPPGTGKSSICKTIASCSNRPYVQIALGGVSDETEIRGFTRTYVGSRPGRIVHAIKNSKTMTPLILLDEIDKTDTHRQGVQAALLELLDPTQNTSFVDRYLGIPIDLSNVMFICTANDEKTIPGPLIDRMELIPFRDYTKEERRTILEQYLMPKIIEDYNLFDYDIPFDEEVLDSLSSINGIRQIETKLRRLYRMAATDIFVYEKNISVTTDYAAKLNLQIKQSKKPVGFSFNPR